MWVVLLPYRRKYKCSDDIAIEDFELVCSYMDKRNLKANFEFLCNYIPELLDAYAGLIDFAIHTASTIVMLRRLRSEGAYADYILPLSILYIISPHVFSSYANLMLGFPHYVLYSFRIIAEALAAAAYIDIIYDGESYDRKISSSEYKHFSLCSKKRTRPKAGKVFGEELVERTCNLLNQLSSLWLHPIAGYGRGDDRKPGGQLYTLLLYRVHTGTVPRYVYPPPVLYSEEDLPLLRYLAKLAEELYDILIDIYMTWNNKFNLGPGIYRVSNDSNSDENI